MLNAALGVGLCRLPFESGLGTSVFTNIYNNNLWELISSTHYSGDQSILIYYKYNPFSEMLLSLIGFW